MSDALLRLDGVSKAFPPAVQALSEAAFELWAGEVHALMGENGAGKSTLARIIAGLTRADSGVMHLRGHAFRPETRRDAEHQGVRMVMQELNLVPTLTVAESIFIDRLPSRFGWIDRRELRRRASEVLERVGLQRVDPDALVGSLGIGQQQLVEIAAGLSAHCRVLILDEPTAALTDTEVELLFTQIANLKKAGVGIIYISHRMEEIARIADQVTVLRDGKVVGTGEISEMPRSRIVRLMVGRDLTETRFRSRAAQGEVVLRVEDLTAGTAVRGVSFELRKGEILGFAGLMGSGRTETMRAIFGADPKDGGRIYLQRGSKPSKFRSPGEAIKAGIALLTEDRKREGLLLPLRIRQNITLACLGRVRRSCGWISEQRERDVATELVRRLQIRCASVDQMASELSGGNQQKVVIAKWLHRDSDILIFDEPTRGIDVGAKFEIYRLLVELAERGKGIIVVSSELPELFTICNRIAVMSAGRMVRVFEDSEFDQDAIMKAALSNY